MAYYDPDFDPFYDMNARADYMREAYGDRCRVHGTLTWGGDCPNCYAEEADLADDVRELLEDRPELALELQPEPAREWSDDDIPF
jgi:hypothetical protein